MYLKFIFNPPRSKITRNDSIFDSATEASSCDSRGLQHATPPSLQSPGSPQPSYRYNRTPGPATGSSSWNKKFDPQAEGNNPFKPQSTQGGGGFNTQRPAILRHLSDRGGQQSPAIFHGLLTKRTPCGRLLSQPTLERDGMDDA